MSLLLDKHLLYVTGKGGVGKTTIAAALGLAAAARGRRTIVCEVAEQDRVSRAFHRAGVRGGRDPIEVQLADDLWAITIDPQQALEEWLARQLHTRALFHALVQSSAFQYFVAAAPGAKEMITLGKVWELAQAERWDRHNPTYDLVIVDAPASGHGVAMLSTPQSYAEIARAGRIRRQADKVRDLLCDGGQTGYLAVATPEEMPVAETLELQERLRGAVGLGLDAVVVNAVYPQRFSGADADALRAAADDGHDPGARGALRAALAEYERARAQRAHLRRLRRGADARVVTLPFLFEAEIGLDAYRRLARELERKLL